MAVQHKFVSFAEFKARTDGPGGFTGYISRWGELDDGGDIVAKGAHVETIPQFLEHGFITNNHDWVFNSILGYPLNAKEDEVGTWVEVEFHSTPDAQAARIKAQERMKAGLDVRLSMGYEPINSLIIEPKDYQTEIPKYSKPDYVASNLEKAGRFPSVRVLLKETLYEGALVAVPMLGSAAATTVKSGGPLAGLTLEEHSKSVLAAVGEYSRREADLSDIRKREGRPISDARRQRITAVLEALDGLDAIKDDLRALLEETAPKPKEDEQTSKQLIAGVVLAMIRRDSARRGVPIQ